MLVYSFHVYMWPCRLLRLLDSWLKNFIWSGNTHTKKVCTVSWKVLCRPWSSGVLDIKPSRLINDSFMLKLAWNLISSNSQWAVLCGQCFLCNGKPRLSYFKSFVWPGVKTHVDMVLLNSKWIVGSGNVINLWTDNWLGEPLADLLPIDPTLHVGFNSKVEDIIVDGGWSIPDCLRLVPHVDALVNSIILPVSHLLDTLAWLHSPYGSLSAKQAFSFLQQAAHVLDWPNSIWRNCVPPSHSFIF